jgi:CheY-like chemotaxis protein
MVPSAAALLQKLVSIDMAMKATSPYSAMQWIRRLARRHASIVLIMVLSAALLQKLVSIDTAMEATLPSRAMQWIRRLARRHASIVLIMVLSAVTATQTRMLIAPRATLEAGKRGAGMSKDPPVAQPHQGTRATRKTVRTCRP